MGPLSSLGSLRFVRWILQQTAYQSRGTDLIAYDRGMALHDD